jgi:Transposase DDE domain group 1
LIRLRRVLSFVISAAAFLIVFMAASGLGVVGAGMEEILSSSTSITAAFDGGRLTSDGGVMLLAMAERRLGVADRLAHCFPDRRDPTRITHTLSDMIRARIFAISCGYEDAADLDFLRTDPAFKLACGKLPDTGSDLCSQPSHGWRMRLR